MRSIYFAITVLAAFGFGLAASPANADLGLRCGTRLITPGDSIERVLNECGEPSLVNSWEEERIHRFPDRYYDDDVYNQTYGPVQRIIVRVTVQEWTYNHGPHRFIDRVRFENGRVRKITSGGYGY